MRIILQTLKDNQLFAKLKKCEFWLDRVSFLFYVISETILVGLEVKVIVSWNMLNSITKVRIFLDLVVIIDVLWRDSLRLLNL